jgi:hypothetical protein
VTTYLRVDPGARGTDELAVVQRMAKAFEEDPGWDFKVEVRETVVIAVQSAWRDR